MTNVKEFSDKYYITKATVLECGEEVWEKFRQYVLKKGLVEYKSNLMGYWESMGVDDGAYCVVLSHGCLFWRGRPYGESRKEFTKQNILSILYHYGYIKQEEQPMSKFKAMKFRVKDAEHSAHIQKYLFSLGYAWLYDYETSVAYTDKPFIYADCLGWLNFGSNEEMFFAEPEQEHTLDVHTEVVYTCSPVESRGTIELNGVYYYVDDLEKALQHIKPVENA